MKDTDVSISIRPVLELPHSAGGQGAGKARWMASLKLLLQSCAIEEVGLDDREMCGK